MYTIDVELTLQSPLHIGALAPAGAVAMRGLVKDADGWPYVPASAFKGRLRHSVERLAHGLGRRVCATHRDMCREAASACPACQIFGSAWLPGPVHFIDLTLCGPAQVVDYLDAERRAGRRPGSSERYGVGLNRRRKVAADQLLYTTELFQPGAPLVFGAALTGIPDLTTAAWLFCGLSALDSLGSSRSRGLGWLSAQATVRDQGCVQVEPERLKAALEAGL